MANFPVSLPSFTITSGTETFNGAAGGQGISGLLNLFEGEIVATATKIGTGSSTPTANTVLRGNGVGTSVWGAVVLTTDVSGILPVANGGTGSSTASTGSGGVVLATSPTLATPILSSPTIRGWDGWEDANESWAFASATTITVPTDATTKYAVGDRIKLTQTAAVKFFVITGVTATVLTINGGTDFTLANSAISANFYSHEATPVAYPHWYNYTPAITANAGSLTTVSATGRFSVTGKIAYYSATVTITTVGTASGSVIMSMPVTGSVNAVMSGFGRANSVSGKMLQVRNKSTTLADIYNNDGTFPGASGESLVVEGFYELP